MSHADDLVILGFLADPTLPELDQRWRQLRSSLHPDRGGDPASFDVHRRAYDRLRAHLLRPRPCEACDGTGFTHVQRGWTVVKLMCAACRGTGRVVPLERGP